jgi:60 kDa SS-A/Ro ribonucleoprotein
MSYLKRGTRRAVKTPQSRPLPGSGQVKNPAGGYVWQAGDWARLRRWLVIGSEGGTYYAGQDKLTLDNVDALLRCIEKDAVRTVAEVVNVSVAGRAPKQDPGIYALAVLCSHERQDVREAGLAAIPVVCRTASTLFMFLSFCEDMRGWGRGFRKAITRWYLNKSAEDVAYQMVKYRQRYGWTHRDVMRQAHPYAVEGGYLGGLPLHEQGTAMASWQHRTLIDWATHREKAEYNDILNDHDPERYAAFIGPVVAYEELVKATSPQDVCATIAAYGRAVPHEAIPAEHMTSDVWFALLKAGMPMTALIRNLPRMSRPDKNGKTLLTGVSSATDLVVQQLSNPEHIRRSLVHPMKLFVAARTYAHGRSEQGTGTWTPVSRVIDALDEAYYLAFDNVVSMGRLLIAYDVSQSMNRNMCTGLPNTTAREASVAMSLPLMLDNPYDVVAFSDGTAGRGLIANADRTAPAAVLTQLNVSPRQRITDVCSSVNDLNFGGTDCALPMLWALEQRREYDAFVVYTDNETWSGVIHPSEALNQYRKQMGINAKLIVHSMTAGRSSICGPRDPHSLDMVGLDASAPGVMAEFVLVNS